MQHQLIRNKERAYAEEVAACYSHRFRFSIVAFAADGVYTATAQGQSGLVPVSVTVKDNKVTRIEVGPNKETVGIGAVAGPKVAQRILDAQSLAVDGVSGATVTSNAVKKATREAITQAGLNLKDWDKKPTQKAALKEKQSLPTCSFWAAAVPA